MTAEPDKPGEENPETEETENKNPGTQQPDDKTPGTNQPIDKNPDNSQPGNQAPGSDHSEATSKDNEKPTDNKKLPKTSTSIYNWLVVGILFTLIGVYLEIGRAHV